MILVTPFYWQWFSFSSCEDVYQLESITWRGNTTNNTQWFSCFRYSWSFKNNGIIHFVCTSTLKNWSLGKIFGLKANIQCIWRKLIYVIVCCDLTFHHDYTIDDYTIDYLHESDNIMENKWMTWEEGHREGLHYGRSRKKIYTLLTLRRGTCCYYTWLYYWRFFLEILIGKYLHSWHVLYWTFILFTSKEYFDWRKPPI